MTLTKKKAHCFLGLLPTVACPASVHGEAGKSIAPPNRQWTNFDRVMDSDVAYHY